MSRLTCSKCFRELSVDSGRGAGSMRGPVVGSGDALLNLLGQTLLEPRACDKCGVNWCSTCSIEAGKKHGSAYYACPECGKGLGEYKSRPTVIPHPKQLPRKPVPEKPSTLQHFEVEAPSMDEARQILKGKIAELGSGVSFLSEKILTEPKTNAIEAWVESVEDA